MKWSSDFEEIIKYNKDRISKFDFNKPTADFLTNYGLPKEAALFLTFSNDTDEQYEGIGKLTHKFDFLEQEYERYIGIGSNGNGDEIVIDEGDNCKVKLLDHEDYFSEQFMNSNIEKLAGALMIYQDFVVAVLEKYGEDGLMDCKYTSDDIQRLKDSLAQNDNDSIIEGSMWNEEIEILIVNKEEI